MKILFVHNFYKKTFIGGEDLIYIRELKALKERLGNENVIEYSVSNEDMTYIDIMKNLFNSKKNSREIERIIMQHNIDLMHVHNFFPLLSTSVFKIAKKHKVATVHTLHNYRFWCIGERLYRNNKSCEICAKSKISLFGMLYGCFRNSRIQSILFALAFYYYRLNKSYDSIDYFFALTEFQKNKLTSFGVDEKRIFIKSNFNELNIMDSEIRKEGFIVVGRLEHEKGVDLLVNKWKELPEDYKLTIIGDGPLWDYIEENKTDNIIMLGKVKNDETIRLINQSKYLIQASQTYESFGLTMIEAFSVGTPVIGFDIGTRKDFILDGINGFIIKDADNIVPVMKKAALFDKFNELSENALEFSEKFRPDVVVEKQIGFYKRFLDSQE